MFKFVKVLTRTQNNKIMENLTSTQKSLGLVHELIITQRTDEQQAEYVRSQIARRYEEKRLEFQQALKEDKKLVYEQFAFYYFKNITHRDFENTESGDRDARFEAMEEAIAYANKLKDEYDKCEYEQESLSEYEYAGYEF